METGSENTRDLSQKSSLFLQAWMQSRRDEDLEKALYFANQALDSCPEESPGYGLALLRVAATEYYSATSAPQMLPKALADFKSGLAIVPESVPERLEYANVYLQALKTKLAVAFSLDDLDFGIDTAKCLLMHSPQGRMSWEVWYDLLTFYTKKIEATHDRSVSLVNDAIAAAESCLGVATLPSALRRRCYYHLCNLFFTRFLLRDKSVESDIDSAVNNGKSLIAGAPPKDENLACWYVVVSRAFAAHFMAKSNTGDLDTAVEYAERADLQFDEGRSKGIDKATVLNNLSNRLDERYAVHGRPADLERAIRLGRQSVSMSKGTADVRVFQQNLIGLLNTNFNDCGDQGDLEEAIELGRGLVRGPEGISDPQRAAYLTVLATSLSYRYSLRHGLDDIREAIEHMQEAITKTDPSHITYNVMRSNLSKYLKLLYSRTKDPETMKEALEIQEAIYHSCNPNGQDTPRYLDLLANSYDDLFLTSDDIQYSDKTLELGRSVISMRGPTDPSRPTAHTNQSARYWSRWIRRQEYSALAKAVDHGRLAVGYYPSRHPDRALACNNLGNMLNEAFNTRGQREDRTEAIRIYLEAFRQESALPMIRIEAGRAAGILHGEDQHWKESSEVLAGCVRMFPRLSPRSVSRDDQQDSLAHLSGISGLACSAAIMAGKPPTECLEILETGRGVISGLAMYLEEDTIRLQRCHREIFEKFCSLREVVSKPTVFWEESKARNDEFDTLLTEIRGLEGFQNFLLCPSLDDIFSLCKRGPIICLNVTELASHAILVEHGDIRTMALPGLSYDKLEQQAATFATVPGVTPETYKATNAKLRELGKWLWETAVGPTLRALRLIPQTPPGCKLPRVYWMPCGLMSHMPIHAAGIYRVRSNERAEDFVVSSYITTLKSAVRNRDAVSQHSEPLWAEPMIISMPETAKEVPLLAREEAAAICTIIKLAAGDNASSTLESAILTNPSKKDVKEKLLGCTMAHLICHGKASANDPSQSKLYLGSPDAAEPEMLTMAELASLNMPAGKAKLAFLSACETAENPSGKLQDEVIHLASGFQLLGFPHVVATLWPASNKAAAAIAEGFYRRLLSGLASRPGSIQNESLEDGIADALHYATAEVRMRGIPGEPPPTWGPLDVVAWAPFVHLGL